MKKIQQVIAPLINPNEPTSQLSLWHVENGTHIKPGDSICDLTTSKINMTLDAEHSGYIQLLFKQGSNVKAGETVAVIAPTYEEALVEAEILDAARNTRPRSTPTFSSKAKALLSQIKEDPKKFESLNFVTEKDIINRDKPVPSIQKKVEVAKLHDAYRSALRSSVTVRLMSVPPDERPYGRQALWAFCTAQQLLLNPHFAAGGGDIGYAMDTGSGIRQFLAANAAVWTIEDWRKRLIDWSLRLHRNAITLSDLGAGQFSLSDLSAMGVFQFEPLLVENQSAILGVGGDVHDGLTHHTLTLAFDHRSHDGRSAGEFLKGIRTRAMEHLRI